MKKNKGKLIKSIGFVILLIVLMVLLIFPIFKNLKFGLDLSRRL